MKKVKLFLYLFIAVLAVGFASCGSDDEENEEEIEAGPAIGDYYYSDGSQSATLDKSKACIGIVFRVKTETEKGLIVSLTEYTGDLLWANSVFETLANDKSDGSANMSTIQNYITNNSKSWSDLPTFNYIITDMNKQTSYSATRDKWYLPALYEMRELAAAFSGKSYKEIADWPTASPMPGYDDQSCIAARTAFNEKLSLANGIQLEISDEAWYWTSTEISSEMIYSFNFKGGGASIDTKSLTGRSRAILAF